MIIELESRGHEVVKFVRNRPQPGPKEAFWNPDKKEINENMLRSCDVVICLGGAGIADKRWSAGRKAVLRKSRIDSVQFLSETLEEMDDGPKTLICASAIGIYGSRGDEELHEDSSLGDDFLADLCKDWEAATAPAKAKGLRVVHVRIGVVIGPNGGALKKMLLPFKLGLGGKIGSGKQWMSWIDIQDLLGIVAFAAENDSVTGAINAVAPHAVTNAEFTKTLGKTLGRPTILPAPGFMMKIVLGEMAEGLLLASQRVSAQKIVGAGYVFKYPQLDSSLNNAIS